MGITHLLLLSSPLPLPPFINPPKTPINPNFSSKFRSHSSSRSNWDPNSDAFRSGRYEFNDDFRREKRRNWWSDDDYDDEEEEEDDDEEEFGFWDESSSFDWVFKVLRAFGWMIPAVMVSTLLGTGTNSLIMALVLPLGQTALSFVMDKLWEGPNYSPDPRPRSKRRRDSRNRTRAERNPSVGSSYRNQRSAEAREARTRTSPERGCYRSWRVANSGSAKKGGQSGSRFGGWDELDEQVGSSSSSFSGERQSREVSELQRQDTWNVELSWRNREKPLIMRLLIAVFPFVGSWTRFLF